jgi:hypothetical protein
MFRINRFRRNISDKNQQLEQDARKYINKVLHVPMTNPYRYGRDVYQVAIELEHELEPYRIKYTDWDFVRQQTALLRRLVR